MVEISLTALLAGYVVATVVPAIAIYVVLANLVERRLEEIGSRMTHPGAAQEAQVSSDDGPIGAEPSPSQVPPAPRVDGHGATDRRLGQQPDGG